MEGSDVAETAHVRKLFFFEYTDLAALKHYLEDMARKGWRLVSMRNLLEFEACEPQPLYYSLDIIPAAGRMDAGPINERTRGYLTLHASRGQSFVCHAGDLCVFVSGDPASPVTLSDSREKIRFVRQAGTRRRRLLWVLTVVASLMLVMRNFRSITSWGADPSLLVMVGLIDGILIALLLYHLLTYSHWIHRARTALALGQTIPFYDAPVRRRRQAVLWSGAAALLAVLLGVAVWQAVHGAFAMLLIILIVLLLLIGLMPLLVWLQGKTLSTGQTLAVAVAIGLGVGVVVIAAAAMLVLFGAI